MLDFIERGIKGHMSFLKDEMIPSSTYVIPRESRDKLEALQRQPIIHPSTINLKPVRCPFCKHLLGYVDGRAQIKCYKCKLIYLSEDTRVASTTSALI
jgi:phage FluMu protein Com